MIFLSIIPSLHFLSLRSFGAISNKSKAIIEALLNVIYLTNTLHLAFKYYQWLNTQLSYNWFKFYISLISGGFLSYIIIARYVLYLKINMQIIPWYLILLHMLATLCLFIRGFTSFSWSIIPIIFTYYPSYAKLLTSPLDDLPSSPSSPSSASGTNSNNNVTNYGGFMPRHNHNHNHYHPPLPPRSNFYRNCGLTIGVLGLCTSFFACYTYHKTANATILAANAAQRQADIAAVSAGVISKETYYDRYPQDRPQFQSTQSNESNKSNYPS